MKITCIDCNRDVDIELPTHVIEQIKALELVNGPVKDARGLCPDCQRFNWLGRKVMLLLETILRDREVYLGMGEKDFTICLKTVARMVELPAEQLTEETLKQELRFQMVEAER